MGYAEPSRLCRLGRAKARPYIFASAMQAEF